MPSGKALSTFLVRWIYTPPGSRPMSYSTKLEAENLDKAREQFLATCRRDGMPMDRIAITGVLPNALS